MTLLEYMTHDNGLQPFQVIVGTNEVIVNKNTKSGPKLFKTYNTNEVFVGKKSPIWGTYGGLSDKKGLGNTILIKHNSSYVYVGDNMFEFSPVGGDTIVSYYSDLSNDAPYAYALGKKYVYLMSEGFAVEKSFFDFSKDLYFQFYLHDHNNNWFGLFRTQKWSFKAREQELREKSVRLKIHKLAQAR
jgi:hypothetical protein